MTVTSLVSTVPGPEALAALADARARRNQVGLPAGVLCSGCRGSASAPCAVCRVQRQVVVDMAAGGRSVRGIARSTGLAAGQVNDVLNHHVELGDVNRGRRDTQKHLHAADQLEHHQPMASKARNRLIAGEAIPCATIRAVVERVRAEEGVPLSEIGVRAGYADHSQFARLLGYVPYSRNRKDASAEALTQRTISCAIAARICRALHVDPREVPGL